MRPAGTTQRRIDSAPPEKTGRFGRQAGARKDALRRRLLFTADVLTFLLAVGAMTVVEGTKDPLWALVTLPGWILVAKLEELYDADHPKIWHLTIDEAQGIFHWITLSVAATLFFIRALPDVTLTVDSAIALYATALAAAFLLRAAARAIWRRMVPPEQALVLGSGALADAVARKLALEPGHHLSVLEVGTSATAALNGAGGESQALRFEDLSKQDLKALVAESGAERVVLAMPELDESTLARVVSVCRSEGVKLSVMPPMRAMLGTAVRLSHIAELPVIEYGTWGTSWSSMVVKRAIDVVLSALVLVVLSPLMLLIALAVKLDSRGPALFKQLRAGRRGRPFRILKFRTMCQDAEERISEVVSLENLSEPMFKVRDDPRVTRVGPLPAPHQPRRTAPAHQRAAGRDEPRRPTPGGGLAGRALRRDGALPPGDAARPHRSHAGSRAGRAQLPGAHGGRARVRGELQPAQGPEDPAPYRRDHAETEGRVLTSVRSGPLLGFRA